MNHTHMMFFSNWFDTYVSTFYTGISEVDVNYVLKEEHTQRVRMNCLDIAASLQLNDEDTLLAEVIGLFHDIGRFRQFSDYKSFNDAKTGSHATIGVSVLKETEVLSCLSAEEQLLICDSIEYHNLLSIPEGITERSLLFSRMIRDADKLDAFYVITNDSETRGYSLEQLSQEALFSQIVVDCILNCKGINFKEVKTYCDRKLLEMSLIYDLNFKYSKDYVIENKYIEKLIDYLPESNEKSSIQEHFITYLKDKE